MKHVRLLVFCWAAFALLAEDTPKPPGTVPGNPDKLVVEEIIAKVNGDIVTRSEIERGQKQLEAELRQQGLTGAKLQQAIDERGKDVFREKIDQLLLVQKGKELNINVDAELSKILADIQRESKIADPDKFAQFIKEQSGMTIEDFKAEYKNNLLTRRVIQQEVGGKINIPREEVEKYYNEHKTEFVRDETVFLREILISTEGKDAAGIAAAEKKAKDLVARARKGEKFFELARDNSDSPSAKQGGDLGGWKRGQLDKKIEDLVFANERGYVSDPIKVANGFMILRVEERFKPGQAQLNEVENEIMERLYTPRFQPKIREYLTQLRSEAFLEIKPGYVDTGAAPGKETAWTDPAQLKPETVTKEEVENTIRKRKVFWTIPVPGTAISGKSSSRRVKPKA